jgi:ATP-dependent Zn protease
MRTETRKSLRQANAHHEAGHAVIAYALGYKPTSATIVPSRRVRAIVSYPNPLRGIKLDIDGQIARA